MELSKLQPANRNKILAITLTIICIVATFLVYSPGLSGDFILDDFPNIVHNNFLHVDNLSFDSLMGASFSSESGPLRRPISMFSFAINYYYFGLDPFSYKLLNLIIHLICGLLLFYFGFLIVDTYEKISNTKSQANLKIYLSGAIAFAWLVAPINLSSVLYVVQRMTSLSALFCISGLILYILARRSMIMRGVISYRLFFLSGILFIFSIFSKENGALFIFYLIIIELCILRFSTGPVTQSKSYRNLFLFLTITPLLLVFIWLIYDPSYITNGYAHRAFSLEERVITQPRIIMHYIKWIIAPNIVELGLYHDDIQVSKSLFEPITTFVSILIIILLVVAAFFLIPKMPLLSFGILFYFASHILESTVINLEMVFEHRNYLASFGIIFGVFSLFFYLVKDTKKIKAAVILCLVWITLTGSTTVIRSTQWKDATSQALYESSHHPNSPRAIFDLARNYSDLTLSNIIDLSQESITAYEKAMTLSPHAIAAESAAAIFMGKLQKIPNQQWKNDINNKLELYPITAITIESLKAINHCLLSHDCGFNEQEVKDIYKSALNNSTSYPKKYKAALYSLYAQFSMQQFDELNIAELALENAVMLEPNEYSFRLNLAILLIMQDKFQEASSQINYIEKNDKFKVYSKAIQPIKDDIKYYLSKPKN